MAVWGTCLGGLVILGGQVLEGGSLFELVQVAALLIVLGGTLAAILLSFPFEDISIALSKLGSIYHQPKVDPRPLMAEIESISQHIRKEGLLGAETERDKIKDPSLKRAIKYVLDGYEPQSIRSIFVSEIEAEKNRDEIAKSVFEAAGGYAPTFGIVGAVLGLIHVLTTLEDPTKVGSGIAVAFVATLYGVGFANLLFIPWSLHVARKTAYTLLPKWLVMEGAIAIAEGQSPAIMMEKLKSTLNEKSIGLEISP